jgi:hypothetical protein
MASREEEKRKRREERMAAEAQARSAQNRQRQLQFLLGAILVIGVVVGIVLAVSGGSSNSTPTPSKSSASGAGKIPPAGERDLVKAAAAAGCVLKSPPVEGQSHVTTPVTYKSNPPTSGNHNPVPALDGIYSPGQEPTPEHFVHALEHGRIEIQYRPGTPKTEIAQLETLASEALNGKNAYKILLFENNTKMPYAVAATAWGHYIGCPTFKSPQVFDALRDFRVRYVDKGPEQGIPPNN